MPSIAVIAVEVGLRFTALGHDGLKLGINLSEARHVAGGALQWIREQHLG